MASSVVTDITGFRFTGPGSEEKAVPKPNAAVKMSGA